MVKVQQFSAFIKFLAFPCCCQPFYWPSTAAALAGFQRSVIYSLKFWLLLMQWIVVVVLYTDAAIKVLLIIYDACVSSQSADIVARLVLVGATIRPQTLNQRTSYKLLVSAQARLTPFRTTSANVIIIMLDNVAVKTVNHNIRQVWEILVCFGDFYFYCWVLFFCFLYILLLLFSIKKEFNALFSTYKSEQREYLEEKQKQKNL